MWKVALLIIASACHLFADLSELPHPRLWLTKAEEPALLEKIASDPIAKMIHERVMAEADRILTERTCRYDIPDGKRLLYESRFALHNISHTAWAWRLDGSEEHRLRAIKELEAACALKDWNPSHFLDTGEMATAVAWGYDWLYETLTPEQREKYEKALVDKALKPALERFRHNEWWTKPRNNWAQVCGAGISLAAAAMAGKDGGLSEELFPLGLKLVEDCAVFYQPNGMYPEGPSYWHYGTNYHVLLLAACKPLGMGFRDDPILKKSGTAILQQYGTSGLSYNFADGNAAMQKPSPAQSWIASHYGDGPQARSIRNSYQALLGNAKRPMQTDRLEPLSVLWLPPETGESELPRAAVFEGEQAMAIFRTSWNADGTWFAIKGGTPASSHGHMDVGSFVFDAHGMRWFHDLGADNYNLPGYFYDKRWDYYRLQNRSHNTLEIAGALQDADCAPCPLRSSVISAPMFSAEFDLSAAYADTASKVIRSATFDATSGITVLRDEISGAKGPIVWRAFTRASAKIAGNEVVLSEQGQRVRLRLLSDSGLWSIEGATPPTAEENQNEGFRAVALTVPAADQVNIAVEIQP